MARQKTYDEDITKQVRNQALGAILEVLNESKIAEGFGDYKKQMLLRLATTLLPRVQEISGKDGGAIKLEGLDITIRKNESKV